MAFNAFDNFVEIQKLNKEKLKQKTVTLLNTDWIGDTVPYTQTIIMQGITATNIIVAAPQPTQAILESVSDCSVLLTGQEVDQLTFSAFENKPSVDLTFNLLVGGEG